MASLPCLDTLRLHLRPRSPADLDACLAMDRDRAVTRFVDGPWDDPERHHAFVLARMRTIFPPGLGYWSITRNDRDGVLGWAMLLPGSDTGHAEIGWRLVRRAWGKGHGSEAARAVLDHARAHPDLSCVFADIHPDNAGSIRVAEKLGMQRAAAPGPDLLYRVRTGG